MVDMIRCLDAFSGQQTRLVMVVDGLDSCEQDQVLYVLDAVHLLFTEQSSPFITLLAIDPHIIIKVIFSIFHYCKLHRKFLHQSTSVLGVISHKLVMILVI